MMIYEAMDKGLNVLHRAIWANKRDYIVIENVVWAKLYSPDQPLINVSTPQDYPIIYDASDDWEEYQGEMYPWRNEN